MTLHARELRTALGKGGLVLDGGSATTLEGKGHDLSSNLWSAALLRDDPQAIVEMHLDFLRAGADVMETTTYQASRMGFLDAGMTPAEADEMLRVGCRLAKMAVELFMASPEFDASRYAFERPPIDGSPAVLVIVNTGQSDVEVPNAGALLVASQPTIERTAANTLVIPSDTTVWLRA